MSLVVSKMDGHCENGNQLIVKRVACTLVYAGSHFHVLEQRTPSLTIERRKVLLSN